MHCTAPQLLIVHCGCEGSGGRWQCRLNISNYSQSCIRHQRETGHELPKSRGEETTNWFFASKFGTMDLEKSLTSISMGNDFMKAYCTCWHGKRLGGGDRDYRLVTLPASIGGGLGLAKYFTGYYLYNFVWFI